MQQQRGGINNYMPINNRNNSNASNMGSYGGQSMKRMRSDDPRSDNVSATHRMKWDPTDEDNNITFMERNDIDQRSEYKIMTIFLFVYQFHL
jgi:hypothetical protein